MKKKLLFQIGALIAVFLIVVLVVLGTLIYVGSTSLFLNAKNEMIDRDLVRIRDSLLETPALSSMLDYWRDQPQTVKEDYSDEEIRECVSIVETLGRNMNDEDFAGFSDVVREGFAKDQYRYFSNQINYEKQRLDYNNIYCIDISTQNSGFVYCIGEDDSTKVNPTLGQHMDVDPSSHPAIRRILSGIYNPTEYEVYDNPNGGLLYIGYLPVEINGTIRFVICVEYDWSSFHKTLTENAILMILLGMLVMTVLCAALLGFLRKRVITPITEIQRSVRKYMVEKDSAGVIRDMKNVPADNELGLFAKDMSDLTVEIDEYISEIQNSQEALKKLTYEVMDALAKAIDAKDEYTNGHSERVAIYARMIATNLGLSDEDQEKIYNMGLLHDIGKIGIPKSIISKTTKLTDEEFELVQSHPILGYEILEKIHSEPELALAARWHHENYDGTGYPDGKKGDEIPFLVRIIAVADSYDAMTSNRSYRKYLPQDVARAEIEKNIGTQFDPEVAKCMISIIDSDKRYALHE